MPSTVLIVDDEKNIRRTVRMVLEGEGFNVEEASSGEEALARLPDIGADVVFLDVQLPGMSGLDAIERISKLKSPEPLPTVIIISGHATLADAVRAVKAGAYDILEKPLDRERLMVALRNAIERRAMVREVAGLRALTDERFEMVGRSAVMNALYAQIAKVAPTRTRVLITGESGTGKELIARAVHKESALRNQSFIKVNCAAIPPELIESELFGHERGAFTGAAGRKRGLFEQADGGTIFLDEIGDMIASAQAKVLRVLQSGEFTRVGGEQTLKCDVRVVAATNRDLPGAVASGQFREDLYFRLAVVPLRAPPLRDRPEDIPLLCASFIDAACRENGMKPKAISNEAVTILTQYPWPGNVRELRNVIERLVILEESVGVGDLPEEILAEASRRKREVAQVSQALPKVELPPEARALPLREFRDHMEREYIRIKLEENSWNISRTANLLGIERTNLHKKMRSLGLAREGSAAAAAATTVPAPASDDKPGSWPVVSSLLRLAAFLGFSGVALGAFGAHGLRDRVSPAMLEVYRTGVLYHLIHALAVLGLALGAGRLRRVGVVAGLFAGGVALFSGSLYLLALTGVTALGAVTPLGGLSFLAGWALLFFSAKAE